MNVNFAPNEIDIKKFKKGKRISKGGFGIVYKIEEKSTGNLYAAKIIDCGDDEEQCAKIVEREVGILICAKHPTIIKLIGYSKLDFQGENNITIIMELAKNGSLADVLKKIQGSDGPKDYTNTSRQIIIAGVSRGMKYLHDRNIIHRDLKSGNILLDDNFYPHITDFGMSKIFEIGHTYSQSQFGGTLPYQAPEIFLNEPYGPKVDVYSFGIVLYEILTDSVPYPELVNGLLPDHKFKIKVIEENYRPEFNFPVKKSFCQLIEKCWSKNPDERPTFEEIFHKLSNKDKSNEFILDDVDMDEFNFYIEDVCEITDPTEKILNKIELIEGENDDLKTEVESLRAENKKCLDKIELIEEENKQLRKENDKLKSINRTMLYNIEKPSVENKKQYDICFILDATSSMQQFFDNSIDSINDFIIDFRICYRKASYKYGAVIMRDPVDYVDIKEAPVDSKYIKMVNDFFALKEKKSREKLIAENIWMDEYDLNKRKFDRIKYPINKNIPIQFTDDIEELVAELYKIECGGGNDDPEDWAGALVCALKDIEWRVDSMKCIVFVTDSNAHGKKFCGYDNHNEEEHVLIHLIHQLIANQYYFYVINICARNDTEGCKKTLNEIKKIYNDFGCKNKFGSSDFVIKVSSDEYWPYDHLMLVNTVDDILESFGPAIRKDIIIFGDDDNNEI